MASQIIGEKALLKSLARLEKDSHRRKIARPALREASGAIRKAAKQLVIEDTGLLKRSIGSVVRTARGNVIAIVGPRNGMKQTVPRSLPGGGQKLVESDPALYAHLVEFGTSHSRPFPFLRPAFDRVDSLRIIAARMKKEITKQLKSGSVRR